MSGLEGLIGPFATNGANSAAPVAPKAMAMPTKPDDELEKQRRIDEMLRRPPTR